MVAVRDEHAVVLLHVLEVEVEGAVVFGAEEALRRVEFFCNRRYALAF